MLQRLFQNIPKKRLIAYALFLGLLPVALSLFYLFSDRGKVDELGRLIDSLEEKVELYKQRQATNMAVIDHFRDADHFYIDKYLETLTFLEPEIEALQKIVSHKNFTGDSNITKRLEMLTGPANSMVFTEGVVQSYALYQETTETLTHSIEVNVDDIRKILSRVEGVQIGPYKPGPNRPQMIVLELKLDKKKMASESEVYVMNMKLLKREYL